MKKLSSILSGFFIVCSLPIVLLACASPTPYQPAVDNKLGYRDQKLDERKYRVAFNGNSLTPRETVEIYLLYRAAELTKENGYDYFMVVDRDTNEKTLAPSTSTSFFGSYGFGNQNFPYYGLGYHWTPGSHLSSSNKYEAVAYITLHKGPLPDNERAYSADGVLKNLNSKIERSEKQ